MIILYDYGNSVCCQKVRITLREKGLEWQAIRVDLFTSQQYDPAYLKLNPKGVVPTLVHDGVAIIESTLICEYLDDTFPDPPLMPKDAAGRAHMRLWSKYVDEGLFEGVGELSFSAMFRERMKNLSPEMRERRFKNVGDPKRRDRFKSTYELGVHSPYVLHGIAAYERAFKTLETTLAADARPWILGAAPTLADINLMPLAARLDYLGLIDLWINQRPHVQAWWTQAQAWPSFKRGLFDLITEPEFIEMRTHGPKIRADVAALLTGLRQEMEIAPK
jgi:glutathione S-transferase